MKRVHIISNIYDVKNKTVADVDNVLDYLKSEFKTFPVNAKIYHKNVDITDKLRADNNYADTLEGEFIVMLYPALEPATIIAIVSAVVSVGLSVYMMLTMPKAQRAQAQSPNNELTSRQNSARLSARIPDIYGQVRSYPDLISETYTYYNSSGIEVERSLLCIGRGYYQINDVKDASTDVGDISGTSISIYNPDTSIIGTPIYQAGRSITDLPLEVISSPSITGQTLDYPNDTQIESEDLYFTADGKIHLDAGGLGTLFSVGDSLMITGAEFGTLDRQFAGEYELNTADKVIFETTEDYQNVTDYQTLELSGALVEYVTTVEVPPVPPETTPTYVEERRYRDFSGHYPISSVIKTTISGGFHYEVMLSSPENVNPSWNSLTENKVADASLMLTNNTTGIYLDDIYSVSAVTSTEITLSNPEIVNPEWLDLLLLPSQSTHGMTALINLDKVSSKWVGWHKIEKANAERIVVNLHFPNGLYRQNSKGGTSSTYTSFALEYQVLDEAGLPLTTILRHEQRFDGATRVAFGRTIDLVLPVNGSVRFRACKTRASNPNNEQATMNIKDVYLASVSTKSIYGGVTVIQSEAIGTDGLYSIKERKLNCLVTRKLPLNGTGALVATKSGVQALIATSLDDKIGRREISEVDITQVLAEESAISAYFGSSKASEFSYTFDDSGLSFEEIAGMIASSMFCEAYRYGSKLRMNFESPQTVSTMLFNHRNTIPKSMKVTHDFGIENHHDGVEIEYTDPSDDLKETYIASDVLNPTNLKTIKTSGIRTHEQGKTRAWREWNKLKFQNMSCELEALDESNLLSRMDRILVADKTRLNTVDGEVDVVNGLELTLSQKVPDVSGLSIYLQLPNKTTQLISCLRIDDYTVQLTEMPTIDLSIGRAMYQLIQSSIVSPQPYLVTEIRPQGKMTNTLTCVNYDSRYYQNDHDYF